MTFDVSKNLVCILMRSGIEIWVEKEKADILIQALTSKSCPQFIHYEDKLINKSDITGVFTPQDMEERTYRKNGMWKCGQNNWHKKFEECCCLTTKDKKNRNRKIKEYKKQYGNLEPF